MRPIHQRLLFAVALVGPLAGTVACSGSAGAAAPPASTSTKPAHDYRQLPQLEQFVTDEFNAAYADPADVKYAPGVTVKSVKCVQQPGTSAYDCVVTPSTGQGISWPYVVAADGGSVEHGERSG